IQAEINQRLDEIDRISEETSFNGVNVLANNTDLTIQVGANDGETISIALQKVDSSTLGLEGFSVSNNTLNISEAITQTNTVGTPAAVDLSAAATSLGVDAASLTLHNVQD